MPARTQALRLGHRDVLAIAVPMILSNVTTPLIGAVDTAVIGQLGAAHLIGAVAVGAAIFTMIYWAFGFLRMGTTGLTAQASGARKATEVVATLYRALLIAVLGGTALIALQSPLAAVAFPLMGASAEVEQAARAYFGIRIWSAPGALANYALIGWFIGLGRAGTAFRLQLFLNGANMVLDALFVLVFGWGVAGVAAGTLIAEMGAAAVGIAVAISGGNAGSVRTRLARVVHPPRFRRMLSVNGDIMVRTVSLLFAFSFFTAQAARSGDMILAANAVLLNFLAISSYLLDGVAFSAEVLVGKAIGSRDAAHFRAAARLSSFWAVAVSAGLSLAFWFAGGAIIDLMTINQEVRALARSYLVWAALSPVIGVACFQLDGIFIGATRTKDMRNMMIISLIAYLLAWALLVPRLGNHGLWAALMVFFAFRAATLALRFPALMRSAFGIESFRNN